MGPFCNSTTGIKLVVNYQISTNINSTNTNSNTGSKLAVNYQISTNVNSITSNSITGSKLVVHPPPPAQSSKR